MFQKILAGLTAAVIAAAGSLFWTASAEENTRKTVEMEKSPALFYESNGVQKPISESEITGRIVVAVQDYPVHVNITRYSIEEPVEYYDADITPDPEADVTEFVFLTDRCEWTPDASQFEHTYTSDKLSRTYTSVYRVTISEPKTEDAVFADENVIIADSHAEADISGNSVYTYQVSFSQDMKTPVSAGAPTAEVTSDGSLAVSRSITMLYKPYTLGDTDDDGEINARDVSLLLSYAACTSLGMPEPAGITPEACDINQDGAVNANDAVYLLTYCGCIGVGEEVTLKDVVTRLS